jgi:hypothetical protein
MRVLETRWTKWLALVAFLSFNALLLAVGCASLPEPESEDARLYVRYCSGTGCHGPILPQAGGRKYWDMQTDRMFILMRNANRPLPNEEEKKRILQYLYKYAQGAAKN